MQASEIYSAFTKRKNKARGRKKLLLGKQARNTSDTQLESGVKKKTALSQKKAIDAKGHRLPFPLFCSGENQKR